MGLLNAGRKRRFQERTDQLNRESAERINQAQIDWSREYFDKTNAYNTPTMQMARFEEAGLNPHLIYGQGSNGNASQPSNPPMSVPQAQGSTETNDLGQVANLAISGAQAYIGAKKTLADIANTEASTAVQLATEKNVESQTVSNYMNSARTNQQINQSDALWGTKVAQEESTLRNLNTTNDKLVQDIKASQTGQRKTEQEIRQGAQAINESIKRIELMEMQGRNAQKDTELKQLDIQLKQMGIQPSDPAWLRMPAQIIQGLLNISGNKQMKRDIHSYNR